MQSEILRIKDVIKITQLSRTSIWRYVKSGSFPKPVALGGPGVSRHGLVRKRNCSMA